MSGQTDMAKHAASAQGHNQNNITVAKKKKSTTTNKQEKERKKKDFIKPHVEEIIATEETPDPNEIHTVETEKDTENNQQAAKETDGKTTKAEVFL